MRRFISVLAIATLCVAGSTAYAQDGAKDEAKKAGAATKEAGKSTASAAKHIGKAAAKGTVKGTKKVAGATKNAAQERYACADGTFDEAVIGSNASKNHGGVVSEVAKKK